MLDFPFFLFCLRYNLCSTFFFQCIYCLLVAAFDASFDKWLVFACLCWQCIGIFKFPEFFFFFLEKAAQLKSCYDERIESLHLQQEKQLVSVRPPQQSEMHQSTRWLSAS